MELRISVVVKIGPGSRIMLSPASSEGDGQDEMTRLRHALQHARHSPRKVILLEFDVSRSGFLSCSYFVFVQGRLNFTSERICGAQKT